MSKPLENLKDEFYCGKMGAKIAMMKTKEERITALSNVPKHLQARVEHIVRITYDNARPYRNKGNNDARY
jgi:hypothetical protein